MNHYCALQHNGRSRGAERHDAMVALSDGALAPPRALGHVRARDLLQERHLEVGTPSSSLQLPHLRFKRARNAHKIITCLEALHTRYLDDGMPLHALPMGPAHLCMIRAHRGMLRYRSIT